MSSEQKNNHELNIRHGNTIIVQMLLSRMIALKEGRSEAFQMIIGSKRFSKKRSQEDEADVKRILHRHAWWWWSDVSLLQQNLLTGIKLSSSRDWKQTGRWVPCICWGFAQLIYIFSFMHYSAEEGWWFLSFCTGRSDNKCLQIW